MRLLRIKEDGVFSLTEYVGSEIPSYAILSHTWGAAQDEVTFEDIMDGKGKDKLGYEKLTFCAQQAAKDNLEFFWIDSCCINKAIILEVYEAIYSMFRWYQDAAKCYAYLSDVSTFGSALDSWDKGYFLRSKWHTRSWTLQELLAPKSVEFFSKEGQRLGDRVSLVQELHNITKIPIRALRGNRLSDFSIDERLSWVAGRRATRAEDNAYSLLGILDVHMPIIYGEGRESAFRRLRRECEAREPISEATASKKAFTDMLFDGSTFTAMLVLFSLLSGVTLGICVMQTRETVCDPNRDKLRNDDGFWALLSQLCLQVLTIYCTLHPVVSRTTQIRISQLWFAALLTTSFLACVMAIGLYTMSWKVAAVLSFVSNLAAVTSLAQLTAGLSAKSDGDFSKIKR
ncbi:heterokaryon incompatibility protein-domain-containing protein [Phaeosphaeriaceae sp. PMI808]|nr:heterokaryon incompatibility protein-domain-containing protein [Phaeosphaeriaceae sp. PMI808]